MANELGLRNVAGDVGDLNATIDRLTNGGDQLIGGVGQFETASRMAYIRGPEGITVSLAEQVH